MESTYILLQQYWWFLISLSRALPCSCSLFKADNPCSFIGRNETQQKMLINSNRRKWEFTFTTLVTFGGAFFCFLLVLFHKFRRCLLGLDSDLALLRYPGRFLWIPGEERQSAGQTHLSDFPYHQRHRCSDSFKAQLSQPSSTALSFWYTKNSSPI